MGEPIAGDDAALLRELREQATRLLRELEQDRAALLRSCINGELPHRAVDAARQLLEELDR